MLSLLKEDDGDVLGCQCRSKAVKESDRSELDSSAITEPPSVQHQPETDHQSQWSEHNSPDIPDTEAASVQHQSDTDHQSQWNEHNSPEIPDTEPASVQHQPETDHQSQWSEHNSPEIPDTEPASVQHEPETDHQSQWSEHNSPDIPDTEPASVQHEPDTNNKSERSEPDVRTTSFCVDARTWKQMTTGETKSNGLSKEWTNILYKRYSMTTTKPCVLTFKYGHKKIAKSRKSTAPLFSARAACKFETCSNLLFFKGMYTTRAGNLHVMLREVGEVNHVGGSCGRHLSGEERTHVSNKVKTTGPHLVRNSMLVDADEQHLTDGNTSAVPSADVLRKAAAEARAKERYSLRTIEDLNIIKRMSSSLDTSSVNLKGDVHLLSDSPLMVHIYSEHFLKRYAKYPNTLHVDATGAVTKPVGDNRPYFYTIMTEDEHGSYPLGHMLAELHTVPAITFFLMQLEHGFKAATKTVSGMQPPRVVTDMSWATMHAISLTFAKTSLPAYIDLAWGAANGEGPPPGVIVSLCACHLAQDVARSATGHLGKPKVKERQMVLWLFGRMQKAKTVAQLDQVFSDMCRLLLSRSVPTLVLGSEADVEEKEDDAEDRIPTESWQSYRLSTSSGRHFDEVRKTVEAELADTDGVDQTNTCRSPALLNHLSTFIMPLAPLWCDICQGESASNATVESWFRTVKKHLLLSKTKLVPGTFIEVVLSDMAARRKEALIPKPVKSGRGRRKRKPAGDHADAEESWRKRRVKRSFCYRTAPVPVPPLAEEKGVTKGASQLPSTVKKSDQTCGALFTGRETRGHQEVGQKREPSPFPDMVDPIGNEPEHQTAVQGPLLTKERSPDPDDNVSHATNQEEMRQGAVSPVVLTIEDDVAPGVTATHAPSRRRRPALETLNGTEWVDDEAIDLFLSAIAGPTVAPFTVLWHMSVSRKCFSCTRAHLEDEDLQQKTMWLVPYNRRGSHWALFVVLWRARRLLHLDCLLGAPAPNDTVAVQQLMQASAPTHDWTGWLLVVPSSLPKQRDGYSCGPRVCWLSEMLVTGEKTPFDDQHMRERMRQRIWNVSLLPSDSRWRYYR